MVFLPSILYGSLRVETSNQPTFSFPSPTILPQSLIRPLTKYVSAPRDCISLTFISGVSSGQKTVDLIPAHEAYAAIAAPAFPLVGIAK